MNQFIPRHTMLASYSKAIQPQSLLDVVPKEVLQSHMQGFFYGFRAGTVLIYDDGVDSQGKRILKRLEPIDVPEQSLPQNIDMENWRGLFENFNPFCASFRKRAERNQLCEACDLRRAAKVFDTPLDDNVRYNCHMGLIDMTMPIKIAGSVRGVLFGGQKIVKEDAQQLHFIQQQVSKKASEISAELLELADKAALPEKEVVGFEQGFRKFVEAVQRTADAFMDVRRHEGEYSSLLTVAQEFGVAIAEDNDAWIRKANDLLSELSRHLGGAQLLLLERRGSRYQCIAESSRDIPVQRSLIPVSTLIELPLDEMKNLSTGDRTLDELVARLKLNATRVGLVRTDAPSGGTDAVSLVLLICGSVPEEWARIVVGVARSLAYPAGVSTLIERIERQRIEHATKASYVGHHLKTPVQAALSLLDIVKNIVTAPQYKTITELIEDAESQIQLALADANRLQDAASEPVRETIDVHSLINEIVSDLAPIAKLRSIQVRVHAKPPDSNCRVNGFRAQLRVAFTNLLENALKYSFESKWVHIRFRTHIGAIKAGKPQKWLVIEIEDAGVGFPPAAKEELFSLGVRLDKTRGKHARTGSGIGLVQAKEYIELNGGFLDIDSKLAAYSKSMYIVTATIHLPLM